MTDEVFAVYRGIRCVCSLPGGTPGFADVAWFVGTVCGDVVVSNARAYLLGITLVGLLIFGLLERKGIYPRPSLMTFFVTRLGFDHLVFKAKFSLVAANQRPGLETRGTIAHRCHYFYHDCWCFVPAYPCYGGCAREALGSAGFLLSRFSSLRIAATHSPGNERGGSSLH